MKKEANFKNDDYVKVYPAGDVVAQIDFLEDVNDIEKNIRWIKGKINGSDVKCIAGAGGPLFAPQLLEDYKIYGNDLEAVMATITDGSEMGYAEGSQFMFNLAEDEESKPLYYLLSKKAVTDLADLTGSACAAFYRRTLSKREEDLNYDMNTSSSKKEIYIQVSSDANKALNTHGGHYCILRKNKMLYGIVDAFDERYPGYEFRGGLYSHSVTSASWAFPDQAEEILKLYEGTIAKKAPTISFLDATPVVKFYTSDSGDARASLEAYLEKDNLYQMKIGEVVKLYHKGDTTEQDIIDAAGSVFAKFGDLVARMAELVNIDIKNPINCMLNAGLQFCKLNKTHLLRAIEEFQDMYGEEPENITGNDVFYVLQRGLYNMRLDKKISEVKIEDCEEDLLKLLSPNFSWETYDTSVVTKK